MSLQLLAVVAALTGAAGVSQSSADVAPRPADVARCTAIESDAERLACYDKLFARAVSQQRDAETTVAARVPAVTPPAAATHDDFGFDGHPPPGSQSQKPQVPDEMQARIAGIVTQPRGEHVLTLDNGQVWEQKESDWHLGFNVGDEVIIKRGAFKSYRLQLKGNNRATPVTRIR
jgi:phospholipase A1